MVEATWAPSALLGATTPRKARVIEAQESPGRGACVPRTAGVYPSRLMVGDQLFAKKATPPAGGPAAKSELAAPAYYARRKKRHNEICQILIRNGDVTPEAVRKALKIQEDRGGQIGRILVKRGACTERALADAAARANGVSRML